MNECMKEYVNVWMYECANVCMHDYVSVIVWMWPAQMATIWGPRWPGAGSGAPANKNLNRKATIWGPRWPGAGSGAPANKDLN